MTTRYYILHLNVSVTLRCLWLNYFLHEFCRNLDVSTWIAFYAAKIWLCLSWVEWPFSNRRYHYIPEIGRIRSWGYILTWDDYKKWSLSELHAKASLSPLQYIVWCLIVRSREFSKPRDCSFELSHRFRIRQALRQYCCRTACQISERSCDSKYRYFGFENLP